MNKEKIDYSLPIYDLTFDANLMDGVNGISLVNDPAIGIKMIKFSNENKFEGADQNIQIWKLSNQEQRTIASPVLIPGQLIYRNDINGKPGYLRASKELINDLMINYTKKGFGNNSKLEHEGNMLEDITFYQNWQVVDSNKDTSNNYGYTLPIGTWFSMAKVNNDDIWNNYIKTGEVLGFSIDAMLGTQPIKLNCEKNKKLKMNKQTINDIVSEAIKKVALASELMEVKIDDVISYFVSSLEVGSIVTDKDGNPVAGVSIPYEGNEYKTDEMGAIVSVETIEEEKKEVEVETELADVTKEEEVKTEEAPKEEVKTDDVEALKAKIEELTTQLAEKEKELSDLKDENVKLEREGVLTKQELKLANEMPASQGILPIVEEVKWENLSQYEKWKQTRH